MLWTPFVLLALSILLSFCHIFIFNKNLHYDYFGHVEKKVVIKVTVMPVSLNVDNNSLFSF